MRSITLHLHQLCLQLHANLGVYTRQWIGHAHARYTPARTHGSLPRAAAGAHAGVGLPGRVGLCRGAAGQPAPRVRQGRRRARAPRTPASAYSCHSSPEHAAAMGTGGLQAAARGNCTMAPPQVSDGAHMQRSWLCPRPERGAPPGRRRARRLAAWPPPRAATWRSRRSVGPAPWRDRCALAPCSCQQPYGRARRSPPGAGARAGGHAAGTSQWREAWLPPLLAALTAPDARLRANVAHYLLPLPLAMDSASLGVLLERVSGAARAELGGPARGEERAGTQRVRAAAGAGAIAAKAAGCGCTLRLRRLCAVSAARVAGVPAMSAR